MPTDETLSIKERLATTMAGLRWTPLFGQRWGGVKRESRRVPVRRSAAKRVERLGRLPSPFQ